MPWKLDRRGQPQCTNCRDGTVPCPVDHRRQPPNNNNEYGLYFMCPECDWAEGNGESGTITCPECEGYSRKDTYNGPCEFCSSKNRTASDHTFPEHLHPLARERFGQWRVTLWTCPKCFHRFVQELETEYAPIAERKAFNALHAHKPCGTCDSCAQVERLDLAGPDWYICVRCYPTWTPPIPQHPDPAPADDVDGPTPGWYEDPEEAGFLRWWSGSCWVGGPTDPAHCM